MSILDPSDETMIIPCSWSVKSDGPTIKSITYPTKRVGDCNLPSRLEKYAKSIRYVGEERSSNE